MLQDKYGVCDLERWLIGSWLTKSRYLSIPTSIESDASLIL
jgi:hypothetical protein